MKKNKVSFFICHVLLVGLIAAVLLLGRKEKESPAAFL